MNRTSLALTRPPLPLTGNFTALEEGIEEKHNRLWRILKGNNAGTIIGWVSLPPDERQRNLCHS
jgi:hypothetical protein